MNDLIYRLRNPAFSWTQDGGSNLDKEETLADLAEAADELEGLRSNAQCVPTGWKLVPIEPTSAMVEIGCDNNPTSWNEGTDDGFAADVANDVYVSMVRAAPSPVTSTDSKTP